MKVQSIFFDLDGTLTDSKLGITNSVKYALKKLGHPIPEETILQKFLGPPLVKSFQTFCGMQEEEALHAVEVYREYFAPKGLFENEVYPGILPLLSELKRQGYPLVVATSKPQKFSITIVNHFGLDVYFSFVAGSTMDVSRNTKEAVIRYAMEQMKVEHAKQVLMVGDREHDVIGAKACGIPCVGALWGYGSEKELREAGAEALIARPEDLLEYLK